MPKRPCTDRAKWRLLRGKPAQPLPAHYRLDCDYGTPVLTIYREGEGDTPTYLCEVHAAAEREVTPVRRPEAASVVNDCSVSEVNCQVDCEVIDRNSDGTKQIGNPPVPQIARQLVQQPVQRDEPVQRAEFAAPQPSTPKSASSDPAPKPTPSSASPTASAPELPQTDSAPAPATPAVTQGPAVSTASVPATKPNASASTNAVRQQSPQATKTSLPKVNSLSRGPVRDLTYGNPAKALVDETIWNLQAGDYDAYRTALREGKSAIEAAQAAGGQLAVVHRKIQEYEVKIDALLSPSNTAINVDGTIHTVLESETLRIIGDGTMSDEQKDLAVAQLGAFQERINRAVNRPTSPLQAHGVALAVANSANWGAACPSIPKELRAAYRAVYGSLREAIHAAVPDVRDADERLANLYAAKSDLEAVLNAEISTPDGLRITPSGPRPNHEEKFAEI